MPFLLVCDFCANLTLEQCEARGTCERCGVSLSERAQAKRKNLFRRSGDFTAYELEDEVATSLFIPGGALVVHDAWNLLDYVKGQLEMINRVVELAGERWDKIGIVGFATGSLDLMWLLRELIGIKLPNRVRVTRGLAHKLNKQDDGPDEDFHASLKSFLELGVEHLVLVDEVVGGTQMNTALLRTRAWLVNAGAPAWKVTALGMTDSNDVKVNEARALMEPHKSWAELPLIRVPELIAKDGNGIPVKPVIKVATKYIPYRYWPGAYQVLCVNTPTTCSYRTVGAGNAAEAYAGTIRAILKQSALAACWPEKRCAECGEKLEGVRRLVAQLPSPFAQESTVVGKVSARRGGE